MNLTRMNTSLIMAVAICMLSLGIETDHTAYTEHPELHISDRKHIEAPHKTITGEISGFDCAVVGVLCPTTHRGADYTNGVFTEDEEFYFIVNIPQSFLRQHFRQTVEVEGVVYDPFTHAVEPESIYLIEDDDRRLVYEGGYFIDENDRRSTFQDGIFRDGRWTVQ